jgi:hypothetical protein
MYLWLNAMQSILSLINSLNRVLRIFQCGLCLEVHNVWVKLRWLYSHPPNKGRYKLIPTPQCFDSLLKPFIRAADFSPLQMRFVCASPVLCLDSLKLFH